MKQYNGEFLSGYCCQEEEFHTVEPEDRIPFEEEEKDYKQMELNVRQEVKGI